MHALKRARPRGAELEITELRSEGVRVHFEGVKAVDGVDLALQRGELLGLIGPNGAGKTTLVNALTGYEKPTDGKVFLGGRDVTGTVPNKLGPMGVASGSGRLGYGIQEAGEPAAVVCLGRRGKKHGGECNGDDGRDGSVHVSAP